MCIRDRLTTTGFVGALTGNASTATKIASITNSDIVQLTATQTLTNKSLTSPTITGTGSIAGTFTGDITGDVTGDVTGNLTGNVTGNASTATKFAASKTIGGVEFDGSANIDLPGVNIAGNQNTSGNAATATKIASIENDNIVQLTANQTLTNKTLTSPTLTTPALGTPSAGVLTNCTGTASGLTTGKVTVTAVSYTHLTLPTKRIV